MPTASLGRTEGSWVHVCTGIRQLPPSKDFLLYESYHQNVEAAGEFSQTVEEEMATRIQTDRKSKFKNIPANVIEMCRKNSSICLPCQACCWLIVLNWQDPEWWCVPDLFQVATKLWSMVNILFFLPHEIYTINLISVGWFWVLYCQYWDSGCHLPKPSGLWAQILRLHHCHQPCPCPLLPQCHKPHSWEVHSPLTHSCSWPFPGGRNDVLPSTFISELSLFLQFPEWESPIRKCTHLSYPPKEIV